MFFEGIVDIEKICIGVVGEKSVEVVVKFGMELPVASGAVQSAVVYLGWESVADEINMMQLNDF